MWACFERFGQELYDRKTAPISLKVPMLKAEVIEVLMYGCVTWTLGAEHLVRQAPSGAPPSPPAGC